MDQYQLAVIGAGPGGYVAAIKAAQLGLKTAIIEQAEIGGTCLNRGCIPTKTLLHTADLIDEMQHAETFGITAEKIAVDLPALRIRKNEVIEQLRSGVEQLLSANKVEVIRGKATIDTEKQLHIETAEGKQVISAENIIIATGSSPAIPPIPGIDLPSVHTSDTLIDEVPETKRLVIIGGGVIGMEFASIYRSFGAEVTVLEAADRIIPLLDRELAQSLSMVMKKKGCAIIPKALVKKITSGDGDSLYVEYESKDESFTVEADAVLVAIGRKSAMSEIFEEGILPEIKEGRIVVDEHQRTSIDGIYAIGDISSGGLQLAHAASAQGIVAVSTITQKPCEIKLGIIPSCIYTSPEIASIGMTEKEAKDAGITFSVGKYSMAGNARSIITAQERSFAKVIADEKGVIIGAQLMSAHATDIIGELGLGITAGLTASQMLEAVRPHPTFAEAVGEALEAVSGASIHSMPKR